MTDDNHGQGQLYLQLAKKLEWAGNVTYVKADTCHYGIKLVQHCDKSNSYKQRGRESHKAKNSHDMLYLRERQMV